MRKKIEKNSISFEGQRNGEEVLFVFRKHIIAMRKGFYMLLVPFALTAIPPLIWQNNLELFILPLVGFVIGLILFSYHYLMWYFTIYIVTNQRIRQVIQKGFFGKDVVELGLSKIQNISYSVPGFSGEMFGFGKMIIRTLAGDLVINYVEHPDKIYNKLQDAVEQSVDKKGQEKIDEEISE